MFLGAYQHTIDTKGRLAIPAKFRSSIERGAVLVKGVESCLNVFTTEVWEEKARELAALPLDPRQRRIIERNFFGSATECELDSQGRIVIHVNFRRFAGLAGDTTIVGIYQRFEIWNTERWDEYQTVIANEDLSGIALPF